MTNQQQIFFSKKSLADVERQFGPEALGNALVESADEIGAHASGVIAEGTPTNKNPQPGVPRGRLAAGWSHRVKKQGNGADVIIGNAVFYGPFVNFGTGIFAGKGRIFPKKKRAMAFFFKGGPVVVRSIKGQPGQHFAEKGLEKAARDIPAIAAATIEREMGR